MEGSTIIVIVLLVLGAGLLFAFREKKPKYITVSKTVKEDEEEPITVEKVKPTAAVKRVYNKKKKEISGETNSISTEGGTKS